jgi:hypothetical protein
VIHSKICIYHYSNGLSFLLGFKITYNCYLYIVNSIQAAKLAEKEILDFISNLKQTSPYFVDPNDNPQINRLCYIEDWQNKEISDIISQLQSASLPSPILY